MSIYREHKAKDLFNAWKGNCLISQDELIDLTGKDNVQTGKSIGSVPPSLSRRGPSIATKGMLSSVLHKERLEREVRLAGTGRHGKFGGLFRSAITSTTTSASSSATSTHPNSANDDNFFNSLGDSNNDDNRIGDSRSGSKALAPATAKILKQPFNNSDTTDGWREASLKRSRKNLIFTQVIK